MVGRKLFSNGETFPSSTSIFQGTLSGWVGADTSVRSSYGEEGTEGLRGFGFGVPKGKVGCRKVEREKARSSTPMAAPGVACSLCLSVGNTAEFKLM